MQSVTRSLSHALVLLGFPLVMFGCFQTREEIAREKEQQEVQSTMQQSVVENSQGLEKIRSDIGRLQGRIEEVEHQRKKEISGITASQDSQQKVMSQAIDDLKTKVAALQEAQNTLFEEVKKLHEDVLSSASRPVAPAKKKGSKAGGSPAVGFDSALTAYKARDYAAASAGFRAYLDSNPKGKHALDAHYYLGDALFKQKQYEPAVVEFGAVQEKSPTSFMGRRSTLRLAQSFKAMGKGKDAKAFAQLLIDGSPNSDEAKTARKMFK